MDRNIVLAPIIPRFKGLGMKNLQYLFRIYQKKSYTVTNHNCIFMCGSIFYEADVISKSINHFAQLSYICVTNQIGLIIDLLHVPNSGILI